MELVVLALPLVLLFGLWFTMIRPLRLRQHGRRRPPRWRCTWGRGDDDGRYLRDCRVDGRSDDRVANQRRGRGEVRTRRGGECDGRRGIDGCSSTAETMATAVVAAGYCHRPRGVGVVARTSHVPRLGLDLQGGTQVILVPNQAEGSSDITDEQLQQTVEIIRQRVNGFGVAEADVAIQGSGNDAAIVVSVPGVNQREIAEQLSQTACSTSARCRPSSTRRSSIPLRPSSRTPRTTRTTRRKEEEQQRRQRRGDVRRNHPESR